MRTVRKAVIPAAGYGIRLFPASKAVKKEFFPLTDLDGVAKPLIQIIVEEATQSGIEEVCIVCQPDDVQLFDAYFGADPPPGILERVEKSEAAAEQLARLRDLRERVSYAVQSVQEGYGHAVYCAKDWVEGEPFLLLLGDHVHLTTTERRCARQLIDVFDKYQASVSAVARTPEPLLRYFGAVAAERVEGEERVYRVSEIKEKPSPEYAREHFVIDGLPPGEYLSWFGQHLFVPEIFDAIEYHIKNDIREEGEIQLTNAQELLRCAGEYYVLETQGERLDTGIPTGFAETVARLARGLVGG